MKTNRKPKPNGPETFTVGPDPEPAQSGPKRERFQLSFDLDDNGNPDLSGMRENTKEKVRQFFTNPKIAAEFGAKPAAPEVQVFHPAMIHGMYSMVGSIEATIMPKMFKEIKPEIAKQVFPYTLEQVNALEQPTLRVMNKYAAEWMIKYQDEIALVSLLMSLTIQKVQLAIMLSRTSQAESTVDAPKPAETGTVLQ